MAELDPGRAHDRKGAMLAIVLTGLYVAHRLWFVMSGRCPLDGDEGVIGAMALDVLRFQWSPYYYGQDYMGSFQAFAAAPFMAIFGASPLSLRLTAIAEGVVVLLIWRRLLRRWGAGDAWLLFALLFALPPDYLAIWTLKSRGGYIEILFLGSVWLCLLDNLTGSDASPRRTAWRWLLVGLATGVIWWTCQLAVFFLAPGAVLFLARVETRRCLVWPSAAAGDGRSRMIARLCLAAYLVSLAFLMARGVVHFRSSLSAWLFECRWLLIGGQIVTVVVLAIVCRMRRLPLWPLAAGTGLLIGYLPALSNLLVQKEIYNHAAMDGAHAFMTNIESLLLLYGGTLIGVMFRVATADLIVSPLIAGATALLYLGAVLMLLVDTVRGIARRQPLQPFEFFLAVALLVSTLLVGLILDGYTEQLRYALFLSFFATLTLAWFLAHMRPHTPRLSAALLGFLLAVNISSAIQARREPVVPTTMAELTHQEIIDFLLERDIHVASTSLDSRTFGYELAYRLSLSSGERLVVHPVLRLPRIQRYRIVLRDAERSAVITRHPERVVELFTEHGVAFQEVVFDDITVIWDFDKARVDALGLICYDATW